MKREVEILTLQQFGGKLVMVERDVKSPKLIQFYNRWNFQSWNERYDAKDKITYDQMLCVLRSSAAA